MIIRDSICTQREPILATLMGDTRLINPRTLNAHSRAHPALHMLARDTNFHRAKSNHSLKDVYNLITRLIFSISFSVCCRLQHQQLTGGAHSHHPSSRRSGSPPPHSPSAEAGSSLSDSDISLGAPSPGPPPTSEVPFKPIALHRPFSSPKPYSPRNLEATRC